MHHSDFSFLASFFLPSFPSFFLSFLRVDSVTVRATFARNCDHIDFLEEESERAAARSRPHPPFALPFLPVCTTTLHRRPRSTRPRPHGGAISSHGRSIFSVLPSLDANGRRCFGATALSYIDAYVDKLRPTFILSPRVKRSCSLFSRRSHSHLRFLLSFLPISTSFLVFLRPRYCLLSRSSFLDHRVAPLIRRSVQQIFGGFNKHVSSDWITWSKIALRVFDGHSVRRQSQRTPRLNIKKAIDPQRYPECRLSRESSVDLARMPESRLCVVHSK